MERGNGDTVEFVLNEIHATRILASTLPYAD